MNVVLHLISMLLQLSFVLLPFVYLIPKERRWSKSLSKANARPPGWVRTAEVSVLGVFAAVLVLHIATGGFGMATTPLPMAVLRARTVICGIMVVVAAGWMAFGAWRSVPLAAGGMIVSTLVGTVVLAATHALSFEGFEDDIRLIPVPVEITLQEQVPDVDVLINGVRMGQAPLRTTMEEIAAKAPEITVSDEEQRKGWKNFGDQTYLPQQKVSLDRALDVTIIGRHGREKSEKKVDLYVRFERKGRPVMVSGSLHYSGPSRMFGQIQPARIPFSVMTEEWDRDVTLLLEKARLADYRVDAEWFAAADTYFHFVRNAVLRLTPNEPQFQRVLDDWARSRYQLDQVTDAESAWRMFEAIRNQADASQSYNTDSIAGEAVELLLHKLDAERVIAATESRLRQIVASGWSGFGWGRHDRHGKTHFSTHDLDRTNFRPSDYVLAHAVWRLDQKWDAEGNAHDNAAESRLVPFLLRSPLPKLQ